jgi:hypothetical protein
MGEHEGIELLKRWLKRARESQLAHYAAAEQNSSRHLYIGIPAAVLSTFVGTTVFASLDSQQSLDIRFRLAIGMISVLAAILTGCQTFLRFSDKADSHRSAATKFAGLRRLIEQSLSFPSSVNLQLVDRIRDSFDTITESAPNVSRSVWESTTAKAGEDYLVPSQLPDNRKETKTTAAKDAH